MAKTKKIISVDGVGGELIAEKNGRFIKFTICRSGDYGGHEERSIDIPADEWGDFSDEVYDFVDRDGFGPGFVDSYNREKYGD